MNNNHSLVQPDGPEITDLTTQLDVWRANALNTLLGVALIVFTPALFMWFFRFKNADMTANWVYLGLYLFIPMLAYFRQIDYRIRAWLLLAVTYLTGTLALYLGGLVGDGKLYLLVLPILALILIGKKASGFTFGLVVVTYSIMGVAVSQGYLTHQLVHLGNPLDWETWLQGGIVLAACLAIVATMQWKFSQFLKSTASKNAGLYQQIRAIADELEQRVEMRTSELQRTLDKLRSREKTLAAAQRIGQVGSWEWEIEKDIVRCSEESYRIAGISAEEFGGEITDFFDLLHPDDRDKVEQALQESIDGNQLFDIEYRFVLPDQSVRHIHARGEMIRAGDDSPPLMQGSIHDITELVQAGENLRAAKIEAERANQAKSEFLSRMSHELRAPMNLVLGFAQLLELDTREPLSPAQRKSVGYILSEGEHLLHLIDELLDLAKIEAGQLTINAEIVDVSGIASDLHALIAPLADQHQVQIELGPSIQKNVFVRADQQRLHQVLLNLVMNAIKFNHPGGKIALSSQLQGQHSVRIYVQDTGVGIQPEMLDQLFTPFSRLSVEQENVEGTGLGLALSKQLMGLMNGQIGVESTLGEGSTFWIQLPRADRPQERLALEAPSVESQKPTLPMCTVLYIEDYKPNFELLQGVLADHPEVELKWANDGQHGLSMVDIQPDLILLDLQLPDMQGYDVLRQLKQNEDTNEIPVVVLSADATPRLIKFMKDAGATDYITKPIDIRQFLQDFQGWLSC